MHTGRSRTAVQTAQHPNLEQTKEIKMSLGSKAKAQPTAATDIEAVSRQLASLREDMSRLTETVSAIAGRRGSRMAADIAEGFDEAKHYAESKGRTAEAQLEESVAAHPFMTIGLAAGAGFLVGALSRR
ncbi:DUF883 family protein [Antarcticimicrobium luteum]|uniref:DUF883 family protein n=2 Tax=Antarcticimicrobium luteum TaxID=2547397 RepID=A0A4R5VFP5_9RHOB|nr:DUF883 family protein [Antarcticimicrobium luteum]